MQRVNYHLVSIYWENHTLLDIINFIQKLMYWPCTYSKDIFKRHQCGIPSLVSIHTLVYWAIISSCVDQTAVATECYLANSKLLFPLCCFVISQVQRRVSCRECIVNFFAYLEIILRDLQSLWSDCCSHSRIGTTKTSFTTSSYKRHCCPALFQHFI